MKNETKSLRKWAKHYQRPRSTFCAAWYRVGSPGRVTTSGVELTAKQAAVVDAAVLGRGRPRTRAAANAEVPRYV